MTTEDSIQYWLELAEYDLETAKAMLDTKDIYMSDLCAIRLLRKF